MLLLFVVIGCCFRTSFFPFRRKGNWPPNEGLFPSLLLLFMSVRLFLIQLISSNFEHFQYLLRKWEKNVKESKNYKIKKIQRNFLKMETKNKIFLFSLPSSTPPLPLLWPLLSPLLFLFRKFKTKEKKGKYQTKFFVEYLKIFFFIRYRRHCPHTHSPSHPPPPGLNHYSFLTFWFSPPPTASPSQPHFYPFLLVC